LCKESETRKGFAVLSSLVARRMRALGGKGVILALEIIIHPFTVGVLGVLWELLMKRDR
jgi:hypothetical protein